MISIHAPMKGATQKPADGETAAENFNPRTHEGCDFTDCISSVVNPDFNPRTHEGCDEVECYSRINNGDFNPRTHEGCDMARDEKKHC